MTADLDATIARLRSDARFWCSGATKPTGNAIRDLLIDAVAVIDALQAENARLLWDHMPAGFRAGELTAKLLDSEAVLYKCWEKIAEKNRLVDKLQAKLVDAENRLACIGKNLDAYNGRGCGEGWCDDFENIEAACNLGKPLELLS